VCSMVVNTNSILISLSSTLVRLSCEMVGFQIMQYTVTFDAVLETNL